jgi:hypothetical protein
MTLRLTLLLTILLKFSSCDCNYHLERARSKCGIKNLTDTIHKIDTVITKYVDHDTTFYYNQKDTVIVKEGKLIMKYFYNDSTVYIKGECISDTIIKQVPFIVNTTALEIDYIDRYKWWLIGIALFFLLIYFIKNWKTKNPG